MSAGGLSAARRGRLHDAMARHVERGGVRGIVTLASRRGAVHVDALGTMTAGGADPMRRDTIFRIASLTKPVAAVMAMILVEECRLRLDDPIDRLLPELADRRVLARLDGSLDETIPAHGPISLRDLLTLRIGFGYIPEASDGGLATFDPSEGGHWSRPPVFPSARGGLASTVDDYLAFGRMLLNGGRLGRERILSRPSVEVMTSDQLTPEQRASAGFFLGENRGWGSAWPWSSGATTSPRYPASSAGTAATALPGRRTRLRIWLRS